MTTSLKQPLSQLYAITTSLRELDADMAVNTIHVLLLIARNPGISSQKIISETGMTQPSVSRHCAILSGDTKLRKTGGYGFIDFVEDFNDRRNKVAFLTHTGKAFVTKLMGLVTPEETAEIANLPTAKDYAKTGRPGR